MHKQHYIRFGVMILLHFVAMYILMYSMVDGRENVFHNLNQFYMAGLMTASMIVIELALMGSMYPMKKLNAGLAAFGGVALIAFFLAMRGQAGIGDRQFLRSMIPHHAGAILMCGEASITDPGIRTLCQEIVESQEREIAIMKARLAALNR